MSTDTRCRWVAGTEECSPAVERDRLAADNARLRGLIAKAEWAHCGDWGEFCLWCDGAEDESSARRGATFVGHATACPAFSSAGVVR